MKELAVLLGETNHLVGIISRSDSIEHGESRPAVILLNAGLIHRIGPHRIYVKIARKLAEAGFVALRFDLSGIGDSSIPRHNQEYEKRVIKETQQAMDLLASTQGVKRFILIGLCAGASNSIRVARSDERVIGTVLIDSYPFPSTGFRLYGYRSRIFGVQSWYRFVTGKSDLWSILSDTLGKVFIPRKLRQSPSASRNERTEAKLKMVKDLRALVERNISLFLIFSGNYPSYYNYRRVMKKALDALPLSKQPRVKYFAQSDHTFTLLSNQQLLVDQIHDWVQDVHYQELRKDKLQLAAH